MSASLQRWRPSRWSLSGWLPAGRSPTGRSSAQTGDFNGVFTPLRRSKMHASRAQPPQRRESDLLLTSRSVPARVAPRRLQFFSLAFFSVATRRLIPVIWLPSRSTPFRLAPDEQKVVRMKLPQVRRTQIYLPGWPSGPTGPQSCIL